MQGITERLIEIGSECCHYVIQLHSPSHPSSCHPSGPYLEGLLEFSLQGVAEHHSRQQPDTHHPRQAIPGQQEGLPGGEPGRVQGVLTHPPSKQVDPDCYQAHQHQNVGHHVDLCVVHHLEGQRSNLVSVGTSALRSSSVLRYTPREKVKAPASTASQDSSHRPWARRTRLCRGNCSFSSAMAGAHNNQHRTQREGEREERERERAREEDGGRRCWDNQ
ncbi:hypothetical protein J4Q44_G00311740, partial [Coregonus suidteri]